MIKIYEPYLKLNNVYKALESGWLSSQGEYINIVTEYLKDLFKVKHIILQMNGTTATHCLFIALKFKYPEVKKIYVPNNVYIAVYNCVLMEYSIDNIAILKIDKNTLNMDTSEEYILSLDKYSCVVIVHNIGNVINVIRLRKIRPDLIFIEDNCEGLFGKYENSYTGTESLCSSLSFFANKTITSGEGGCFLTNDTEIYNFIFKKCHQGMTDKRYIHDIIAYNYRMTNIQAALLYDQLLIKDEILEKKTNIFKLYDDSFKNNKNIEILDGDENTKKSNWMYLIKIKNKEYDEINNYLIKNNIETRSFFYPYYYHEHLKLIESEEDINSEILSKQCLILPSHPNLTIEEIKYIIDKVMDFI
jgi:perosamine synthetase